MLVPFSPPRLRALMLCATLLLALVVTPHSGAALAAPFAPADDIALTARPAYEGVFRPGSWMPVYVELENGGVDRIVEVRVGTREGSQYAVEVELPNGGRKAVTVYAYLTAASRRLLVRAFSADQELAEQTLNLPVANPRAQIVALVTGQAVAPRLPARFEDGTPLSGVPVAAAALPDHALGLSSFSAVLLEDVPTAELSEAQREALREWVLRGGQLIIGGGPGAERVLAGLPDDMAPASLTAVETLAAEALLGPSAAGAAALPYATFAPKEDASGRAPYAISLPELSGAPQPALEQSLGRGVITVLALPLTHPAVEAWEGWPRLWEQTLRHSQELPAGFAPENVSIDGFVEGNLAASLTNLPALEFPPLGLLMALVATYILLVGPVTYIVLRRLDRQTLGWVIVPIITLVFAALTYGLGYAQRGGDVLLNEITLIEPMSGAEAESRVRSFVGIFSPERRDYVLQVAAPAGDATLMRPISVQGAWDTTSGNAGGVFLQDAGAGAEARDFGVVQWSMRAFTADTIAAYGNVRSELRLEGDRIFGVVENRGSTPLRDATLVQNDRILRLGDLAPGETKQGELKPRQGGQAGMWGNTMPMSYLVYGDEIDNQSKEGGQPLPAPIQQRVRLLDALFNYGPGTHGGQPLLITWADEPALTVNPLEVRAERQHTAIVVGRPNVVLADPEITLGKGWLAPRYEGGQTSACFGGQGAGITLSAQPAVVQLVLPRDLYGFQLSELALLTSSDGLWLDDTVVELYNWTTGAWETQPVVGQETPVLMPEVFLSGHGTLKVRVSSQQAQANFGCVYIDARMTGTMP